MTIRRVTSPHVPEPPPDRWSNCLVSDGIAYVSENGVPGNDPGSGGSLAWVPLRLHEQVLHAADDCPGECIFIEAD